MKHFIYTLFTIIFVLGFTNPKEAISQVTQDYCRTDDTGYQIYFNLRMNASDNEIDNYQSALKDLFQSLQIGDKLNIYLATENNVSKLFSDCFPGCPPQTVIDQFLGLGGACLVQIAKRDKIAFRRNFVNVFRREIQKTKNAIHSSDNPLLSLAAIKAHIESYANNNLKSIIVSSMHNTDIVTKKNLDKLFVELVQSSSIPTKFPNVKISGMPVNSELIQFWKDIYSLTSQNFEYN